MCITYLYLYITILNVSRYEYIDVHVFKSLNLTIPYFYK